MSLQAQRIETTDAIESMGFEPDQSTVTVFAAEGPNQFNNHTSLKAENILLTLADRMCFSFHYQVHPESDRRDLRMLKKPIVYWHSSLLTI
jgi:Mg2+ and Co2+ transporter CorA